MFLLDTDHVSKLQRGSGAGFDSVAARIATHGVAELAFSGVSFHEQALGCHAYINRARSPADVIRGYEMLMRILRAFAAAPVLPFDLAASKVFDDVASRRLRVATMDLRIAAIALSHGRTLVT